jgi:hypothetical protein
VRTYYTLFNYWRELRAALPQKGSADAQSTRLHEERSFEEDLLVGWVFAARSAVPVGVEPVYHWDCILFRWIAWKKCVEFSRLDILQEELCEFCGRRFLLVFRRFRV